MSVFSFYVGIDLGNAKQAICIINSKKTVLLEKSVPTHELLSALSRTIGDTDPSLVGVAVEDRHNCIVDSLLAAGYVVHTINPYQADKFRERRSASGAKDDKRDAHVLARALLTDEEVFKRISRLDDETERLRVVQRTIEQLDEEHRRLSNQLRAHLLRYIPGLLALCEGADERWFWALIEVGSLKAMRQEPTTTWAKLLKENRKRTVTADMITALLALPQPEVSEAISESNLDAAVLLIERLRLVEEQRSLQEKKQKKLLVATSVGRQEGQLSDVEILLSMPGIGEKTAATLLVEAGEELRQGKLETLRALCGVAPVTKSSGKRSGSTAAVGMRKSCNQRLREAMFHAASAAMKHDAKFQEIGRALMARGHRRGRLQRSVGDKMLRVLVAMMKARTLYREPEAAPAITP